MKKIAAALSVLTLTACGIHAGNINFWPERNSMFEIWQTESIFFYDQPQDEEILTASKTITEEEVNRGEFLITETGDLMAFSKTYRTDFFDVESLRVNKNAILSSSSSPYYINKNADYTGFGEVSVNGEKYMLVRQGKDENDILLINSEGEVFNRIGRIIKGRLAILDIPFTIEPSDVRFVPVVSTRTEKSDYISGFELRYNGVKNGKMFFTYTTLGEDCFDQEFSFPVSQHSLEIGGLRIDVKEAGYNKIEYTIL